MIVRALRTKYSNFAGNELSALPFRRCLTFLSGNSFHQSFSLHHPDVTHPSIRYPLSLFISKPTTTLETRSHRVTISRTVEINGARIGMMSLSVAAPNGWQLGRRYNCQLVWDSSTRNVVLHQEGFGLVSGPKKSLEKLKEIISAQPLLKLMIEEGHISQKDIDNIPWNRLCHYRLEELIRSGSSMNGKIYRIKRQGLPTGPLNVRGQFEINGVRWVIPTTPVTISESAIVGHRIRYAPCVDAARNFRIYLLEVIGRPDIEVNRYIPFQWRVGGYGGPKMSGLGRSIDDPDWKSGEFWQAAVDRIDSLTSKKASP